MLPPRMTTAAPVRPLAQALASALIAALISAFIGATIATAACTPDAGANFDAGAPVGTEILATDCASAEQGLEFAPFMIFDFEAPTAQYLYSYVDGTSSVS